MPIYAQIWSKTRGLGVFSKSPSELRPRKRFFSFVLVSRYNLAIGPLSETRFERIDDPRKTSQRLKNSARRLDEPLTHDSRSSTFDACDPAPTCCTCQAICNARRKRMTPEHYFPTLKRGTALLGNSRLLEQHDQRGQDLPRPSPFLDQYCEDATTSYHQGRENLSD